MPLRSLLSRAPAVFAAVLWFEATFYFLGETGKHNDDYGVILGDPAVGLLNIAQHHPWVRWPYFWRPLHLAHASAINTLSWHIPWIGHLELALIHALVAWMLMRFLMHIGIRRPIAWGTAILFLTCPLISEGILWTSASCNAISTAFLLRTLELVRRQAAGPFSRSRTLWIGILAFVTACWYEPAAAAIAVVPLVYVAASQGTGLFAREKWRGILSCTFAAGLGCLVYAALLLTTAPRMYRGGPGSFITSANALPRARGFFSEVAGTIFGARARDLYSGSIQNGWQTLQSSLGLGVAVLTGVLALFTGIAILAKYSRSAQDAGNLTPRCPDRGFIALIGAAIFFAALLPIVIVSDQPVGLRSLYVPLIGCIIFVAALANGAVGHLERFPYVVRFALGAFALAITLSLSLAGGVGMVGFQTQFRLNSLRDLSAAEQLHRLLPNPPTGTVFLPLRIVGRNPDTGHPFYDRALSVSESWPGRALIRAVYYRADIVAAPTPPWLKAPNPEGFRYLQYPTLVAWDLCVPYTLDRSGAIHLIRRLVVVPTDAPPFEVEFPRVSVLADAIAGTEPTLMRLCEVNHGGCVAEEIVETRTTP